MSRSQGDLLGTGVGGDDGTEVGRQPEGCLPVAQWRSPRRGRERGPARRGRQRGHRGTSGGMPVTVCVVGEMVREGHRILHVIPGLRLGLPVFRDFTQYIADQAREPERDRHQARHVGRVPVHLRQDHDLPEQLGLRRVAYVVGDLERRRHVTMWITGRASAGSRWYSSTTRRRS